MTILAAAPRLVQAADEPPVSASQLPCPVEQVVKETREHNAKQGKGMPDSFYQGISENYRKQCANAGKRISDYQTQLKEYRDGKLSDRDGYIILQKISNSYSVLRASRTMEARAIQEQLDALVHKHPEFPGIQDFRLSEEISRDENEKAGHVEAMNNASKWTPQDQIPKTLTGSKNKLIAIYQYQLAFFDLPADIHLARVGLQRPKLVRQSSGAEQEVPLAQLHPVKTLTFQQVVDVYPPNLAALGDGNLLVCTNPASYYSSLSGDEQKTLEAAGHKYGSIQYTSKTGKYRDFCGVISQAGEIVYVFPVAQHSPDKLLMPLGIADGGRRAAVALGERVVDDGEDGPEELVGKIREVFIWESGKLRTVKKLPHFENTNELSAFFLDRKL